MIIECATPADYAAARGLFEEYAAELGVDLCFQGFAQELEQLPLTYGPPRGCLFLAPDRACVALRAHERDVAELKRLYVRAAHRSSGLGRELTGRALAKARALGYRRIVLDTLPQMHAAQRLYRSLGFEPADAYYANPLAGVQYMALDIR